MIVIVGAGLAGLVCAHILREAGQQVLVLERDLVPGGRLRTERHPEGFLLDQGFQVLFTEYPAARKHLSYSRLQLQSFAPGALIAKDGKLRAIADPMRAPGYIFPTLGTGLFGFGDKLRVLRQAISVRRAGLKEIFAADDRSTEQYLRDAGFSGAFIDNFARPFYGGIFLDRSLSTSHAMFRFTFKMLAEGETVLPAQGIQQIPEQLAEALTPGTVRYGETVERVLYEHGRVTGVALQQGEQIAADTVVVATDPHTAARLLGDEAIPHQPVSCVCVYFASTQSFYSDRLIVLNAQPDPYINNLVQISNIVPSYAPAGQHLLSLTLLAASEDSDTTIEAHCRAELATIFPNAVETGLRLLRIMRIPFAQYAQPPGIFQNLPTNVTSLAGLYLASEATVSSSIQGAMQSGEVTARLILRAAAAPAATVAADG